MASPVRLLVYLLAAAAAALSSFSGAELTRGIGICYGQLGNNLPVPAKSVELIHGLKAKRVKIYDANPEILKSLQDSDAVFRPLLRFLNDSRSFFFFDVYPYFAWAAQPESIDLNYSLLKPTNVTYSDPVSGLTYTNLLDQMIDSVYFAMNRLGYPDLRLFIAETGWPNAGDVDQIGANIYNAATYNRNVVKKFYTKPPVGTPAKPGVAVPTMIFALFNENQKPGPGTERHFGLLHPNGTSVYEIDLSGKTPESEFKPLPKPRNNKPPKGRFWCAVAPGVVNTTAVAAAMSWACGQPNMTCDQIQKGGKCYWPNKLIQHANYAFSAYWAKFKSVGGTCDFNGVAKMTRKDPSHRWCKFPSVTFR